ncbi:MAG: sugar ABC transporter permease [Candidatus Omnitrophica bacterium]|nr:sugar ABC transporter permease [Candidatus Omnitrophota bacterium]MCM8826905.1 sugar ABC transporter permease [Candidatus Omnitrophota bacterium]
MNNSSLREKFTNFSFVLPALIIFSIFYLYPFFYTFWLSFHKGDGIFILEFVGLANFKEVIIFDKDWWYSFYNGAFITLWALTFQNILAFMLALGVDKLTKTGKFYRVIFFILPVLSEIIIGLLMRELLVSGQGGGVLNFWLNRLGLGYLAKDWLGKERVLLTTALVHCWKGFGWAFVILLAGLQTIPEQLYESARIDGANSFQCFFKITLPLMLPVVALVFILTILGTMQAFAMILALTRGAGGLTEVPVMRIYNHLRGNQVGLACAEGIILGAILITVSFIMMYISKKLREKYGVLSN